MMNPEFFKKNDLTLVVSGVLKSNLYFGKRKIYNPQYILIILEKDDVLPTVDIALNYLRFKNEPLPEITDDELVIVVEGFMKVSDDLLDRPKLKIYRGNKKLEGFTSFEFSHRSSPNIFIQVKNYNNTISSELEDYPAVIIRLES